MYNSKSATNPIKHSGFTIVELLIVIVVIAVLAAISIVAYTGIQGRARDAQRIQDMNTIVKALEVYKTIHDEYPTAVSTNEAGGWEISHNGTSATNFLSALKSSTTGVSSVPVDPTNTTQSGSPGSSFRNPSRGANNFVYFYYRYPAGTSGCDPDRGAFYVLGIARMDGVPSGSNHPQSPAFSCSGGGNWHGTRAWTTGRFTN